MTDKPDCERCGQPHPRCAGHSKRHGGPCMANPIKGLTVCRTHGGASAAARKAGKDRTDQARAQAAASREVARIGARRDLHPAEALLELVHYQAGIVAYWRERVEAVEAQDLEWGKTKIKTGGDDAGTTEEAAPHIAYRLLVEAQDKLAAYAASALKAGVEERRVQLAERQGALVADVIRHILADLNLTTAQQALVGDVVPKHLRALTGGA